MQRLIVGITGATGAVFGVRLLQALEGSVETHLVISKWALQTIEHEVELSVDAIRALASVTHEPGNFNAPIASGSFRVDGMVIAPCSVRSLAAIAHGNGDTLIHRAADVVLKERRRLVLLVREMPLSEIHLENMLKLARMGVTIMPPMPAFYNRPKSIDDIVDHVVARTLDQLGLPAPQARRWEGKPPAPAVPLHRRT
jgi:4-hydroxy-3-polyprenylbenzoate decarboxylase